MDFAQFLFLFCWAYWPVLLQQQESQFKQQWKEAYYLVFKIKYRDIGGI